MALQFTGGPFAGSYTTNTFTPGRAQPRPTPSQGTPYGGSAFQGNFGGQYNAQRANPGAYAPGAGSPPGQFTGAMQPKPAPRQQPSAYQSPQGPYISTTYAHPGGGWGHSPQPLGQQGGGPSPGAYAPGAAMTGPPDSMQQKPAYQPPQGPYGSTTYAYPAGNWGHSPQPPAQQGYYQPRVSEGAGRPSADGMRRSRG